MKINGFELPKANPERVKAAIAVIERAIENKSPLHMGLWQSGEQAKNEKQAHECGTVCCFGGWLALSPEFKEAGGKVGIYGRPLFGNREGSDAVGKFLGIDIREKAGWKYTSALVGLASIAGRVNDGALYRKEIDNIRLSNILSQLNHLLDAQESTPVPA